MFKVVCSVDSSWHVVNSGGNANNATENILISDNRRTL
jgi:hypothetical protein